ncbi:hypothetical protein EKL30_00295 [Candidimonas sp. SYP-B2681]|uniref:hypothetical protein n=1 Tax=Candidimonas sp. SYP-B2681 TaxID=2497686 RepID=UPI000F869C56|nr:hypothetical protein [Candidimonas sp. SYP-B2681]RTZ47490.1 hypothetical protein EKL30_00295 [Candidimonas sp. SYP-B2681]
MSKFANGQFVKMALGAGIIAQITSQSAYLNGNRQYGINYVDAHGVHHFDSVQEPLLEPVEGETFQEVPYDFAYALGQSVTIRPINKQGIVVGVHQIGEHNPQYQVAYDNGALTETWIDEVLLK